MSELEKPRKTGFTRSSLLLHDQMLIVYLTDPINTEHGEGSQNKSNFYLILNLTSSIDLKQEMTKAEKKYTNMASNCSTTFFTLKEEDKIELKGVIQADKDYLEDKSTSRRSLYSINLKNGIWDEEDGKIIDFPGIGASGASITFLEDQTSFYYFGGRILDKNYGITFTTRQFFHCSLKDYKCITLTNITLDKNIPPNAYHSATLVNNTQIVILGGVPYNIQESIQFNSNEKGIASFLISTKADLQYAYIYNIDKNEWNTQTTINFDTRSRAGHTATYLPNLNSILVYGGTDKTDGKGKLYSDILLLNLKTWTWSTLTVYNTSDTKMEIGRAWHSAELIGNKIVFFYGDYDTSTKDIEAVILDLSTYDEVKKYVNVTNTLGPALKKGGQNFNELFNSGRDITQPNNQAKPTTPNYALIFGSTFGCIGLIALLTILFLLYKRHKKIKNNELPEPLIILPQFISHLLLLAPSQPNSSQGDEQFIWEMDSHYANSTYPPSINVKIDNNNKYFRNNIHPDHRTLLNKRRWSFDLNILTSSTLNSNSTFVNLKNDGT